MAMPDIQVDIPEQTAGFSAQVSSAANGFVTPLVQSKE
jgi:hypothetical protein